MTKGFVVKAGSKAVTTAGVLQGRSANGRKEWKTADGHTLKSIQDNEVDK